MSVLVALGIGKIVNNFDEFGSIRLAGITLPGNAAPVVGSLTGYNVFALLKLCEKLPARSRAVGTVKLDTALGCWLGRYSCEKKKNSFCLLVLKWPGM